MLLWVTCMTVRVCQVSLSKDIRETILFLRMKIAEQEPDMLMDIGFRAKSTGEVEV